MRELSARVRALLRRPKTKPEMIIEAGWHSPRPKVTKSDKSDEQQLKLLPKEFILLEVLLRHCGTVLSTEELVDHVWGSDSEITPDTVRSHVKSLTQKN
jgi:two-component system OmpR family response regulator